MTSEMEPFVRLFGRYIPASLRIAASLTIFLLGAQIPAEAAPYRPPASPRSRINFNLNWKFLRDDAVGAEAP